MQSASDLIPRSFGFLINRLLHGEYVKSHCVLITLFNFNLSANEALKLHSHLKTSNKKAAECRAAPHPEFLVSPRRAPAARVPADHRGLLPPGTKAVASDPEHRTRPPHAHTLPVTSLRREPSNASQNSPPAGRRVQRARWTRRSCGRLRRLEGGRVPTPRRVCAPRAPGQAGAPQEAGARPPPPLPAGYLSQSSQVPPPLPRCPTATQGSRSTALSLPLPSSAPALQRG